MGDTTEASAPGAIAALAQTTGGRWEVVTRSSRHVWDLDAGTYTRLPGPGATPMAWDGRAVAFTRVDRWPQVGGQSLVFFDDPADASWEQWRVSGTILAIIPAGPAAAAR